MDKNRFLKKCLLYCCLILFAPLCLAKDYTVLDKTHYQQNVATTRSRLEPMLTALKGYRDQQPDQQIAWIVQQLTNIPYLYHNAMGEGDWRADELVYQPGSVHLNQNPVYTLKGFDCQTFVQMVMALWHSRNLNEFDRHYIDIAYGAAGKNAGIHYYNRNHFVDGDFNPVNQHNGLLKDVTASGKLVNSVATVRATLTRQAWFLNQLRHLPLHIQVLSSDHGEAMVRRFKSLYTALPYQHFKTETITINYIPKEKLAFYQNNHFIPNQKLLDAIPTPAIVEIICDPKRWNMGRRLIKDVIGTELTVSHLGVVYRQTFHLGEVIYQRITCENVAMQQHPQCKVTPIVCQHQTCQELMFAHATESHPRDFYWYQLASGQYTCTAQPPHSGQAYTLCNRVEQLPLFDYLTDYQYDAHWYMTWPAIRGIHIEQLVRPIV